MCADVQLARAQHARTSVKILPGFQHRHTISAGHTTSHVLVHTMSHNLPSPMIEHILRLCCCGHPGELRVVLLVVVVAGSQERVAPIFRSRTYGTSATPALASPRPSLVCHNVSDNSIFLVSTSGPATRGKDRGASSLLAARPRRISSPLDHRCPKPNPCVHASIGGDRPGQAIVVLPFPGRWGVRAAI
jgi:hypothetical protein